MFKWIFLEKTSSVAAAAVGIVKIELQQQRFAKTFNFPSAAAQQCCIRNVHVYANIESHFMPHIYFAARSLFVK
jgi:hypothetical protein